MAIVSGSVPKVGVVVPHLVVRVAAEALVFYVQAFGAQVLYRSASPRGVGEHIHLKVWKSLVQLSTESRGSEASGWRARCRIRRRRCGDRRVCSR